MLGIFYKHQDFCCTLGNGADWVCPQHTHSGRNQGHSLRTALQALWMHILDLLLQWWNVPVSNSLQATCKVLFCWAGNIVRKGREYTLMRILFQSFETCLLHCLPFTFLHCLSNYALSGLGKQRSRPPLKNSYHPPTLKLIPFPTLSRTQAPVKTLLFWKDKHMHCNSG